MNTIKIVTLLLTVIFLMSCDNNPGVPLSHSDPGIVNISVQLGNVGALAKKTDIHFARLCIALSASGEEIIYDTIPLSGNGSTSVMKSYPNLASLKTWTLRAHSLDINDSVIHSGSTDFLVKPLKSTDININLSALVSMLKANIPVADSVTRCELLIDDNTTDDSIFTKQILTGSTVQLGYDYVQVGLAHKIKINIYGDMWNIDTLLYTGDTLFTLNAGENRSCKIILRWVGPALPPPGQATISVALGSVGTILFNGELEEKIIFDEQFNSINLDTAWITFYQNTNHGDFTLTGNVLRYSLTGQLGMSGAWRGLSSPGWYPTLAFKRYFSGSKWSMDLKATYNLHCSENATSMGAQSGAVAIAFGEDYSNVITIFRRVDKWYQTNELHIYGSIPGGTPENSQSANLCSASDIEITDGYMRATYWFRVVRNGMNCSVYVSYNGIDYVNGLDLLLPVNTSDQQMIVIDGGNYDDAGSYIDYDFITTRRN